VIGEFILLSSALSAIIALRYLLIAGTAYWLFWGGNPGRRRSRQLNRQAPQRETIRHEVITSLIATPIYALPAALALEAWKHGYTRLYVDPMAHGLWWLPVSAVIYLLAHDAFYYWLHRGLHHRLVFAWAHRGHHLSRDPTPFASFSFDPAEALLTAWFLPALTFFIPLQLELAAGLLMLMTMTAVMNHAGREVWSPAWLRGPIGRHLITATHHNRHHNAFTRNFGLYFRFWDKIFKTDQD